MVTVSCFTSGWAILMAVLLLMLVIGNTEGYWPRKTEEDVASILYNALCEPNYDDACVTSSTCCQGKCTNGRCTRPNLRHTTCQPAHGRCRTNADCCAGREGTGICIPSVRQRGLGTCSPPTD